MNVEKIIEILRRIDENGGEMDLTHFYRSNLSFGYVSEILKWLRRKGLVIGYNPIKITEKGKQFLKLVGEER